MKLARHVQLAATHVADLAFAIGVVEGRSPISVIAAAIYMVAIASGDRKTAKEVGDVCGVNDVTIRTSYREMYPIRQYLFPPDFTTAQLELLPAWGDATSRVGMNGVEHALAYFEREKKSVPVRAAGLPVAVGGGAAVNKTEVV